MSNEPSYTDSENQSLRKINALAASLTSDVADGIDVNGLSAIGDKLPALVEGRIPVDIGSLGTVTVNNEVEVVNDNGSPIPVSGTVNILGSNGEVLSDGGVVTSVPLKATSSSVTAFSSTESAQILGSNPNRKLAIIFNRSANTLYVLLGSGEVSSSNNSFAVGAGEIVSLANITTAIQGIFVDAGTAQITELT